MSNVILIGYMGSGKSTVGRRLSYRLRMTYVDTDNLIETKEKMTISDIFAAQGEEAFRQMETDCIKSIFDYKQDYVIAVGGGLPMREENREIMKNLTVVSEIPYCCFRNPLLFFPKFEAKIPSYTF